MWKNADLERKKQIQKLVFPDGIFGYKKKRALLTKTRNAVFDLLDRISVSYGNEKGLPLSEAVPSCGNITNSLTFFNDFRKILEFIDNLKLTQ